MGNVPKLEILKKKAHSYIFLLLATLLLAAFVIWNGRVVHLPLPVKHKHEKEEPVHSDTITALIFYHAADYFVYHGSVIGYQYDLIKQMGKDLNRPVEITIESDPSQAFIKAFSNQYDIVGFDFKRFFKFFF